MLPSKNSTEFKRIKGFVPPPEHASETGKFEDVPEIKEEIDTVEKYLLSKINKCKLNLNSPKMKRKANMRWKVRCGLCLKYRPERALNTPKRIESIT